eukprot:1864351-Alexandrium_andersonii.AAC.1
MRLRDRPRLVRQASARLRLPRGPRSPQAPPLLRRCKMGRPAPAGAQPASKAARRHDHGVGWRDPGLGGWPP